MKDPIAILADAFDAAATKCATKEHAALYIQKKLTEAGIILVRSR